MAFRTAPSHASLSLSLLPAYADHVLVCFRPSCISSYPRMSRSVSGRLRAVHRRGGVGNPPPQGSSLESGLCCPGLSSLNRPHPPHSRGTSRLRRKAAYTQCLRCAGAPRRPASGSGLSLTIPSWHAALYDPGEFDHRYGPELRCRHGLRRDLSGSALPKSPAIRFTRGTSFGASRFTLLRPARLLAPLYGSNRYSPAPEGFYFQASNGLVTLPVAGYNYNRTGLLCWRDLHPLEWQLASLHQNRTCGFPAYGLYGAFLVKGASRHFLSCCCFILLFDPRREHSSVPTAYYHRRRAQRWSRTALFQRRRRLVLDQREHGGRLPVIGLFATR